MKHKQRQFYLVVLAGCLARAATGCSRGASTSLNGTWVKKSGDSNMPDLVTLKHGDHRFRISYYADGGLETDTLLCDGVEHPFSGFPLKMTYSAGLQGD